MAVQGQARVLGRDGGGQQGHQGPLAPRQAVDGLRHGALADALLAHQQHGRPRRGQHRQGPQHGPHGRALRDQGRRRRRGSRLVGLGPDLQQDAPQPQQGVRPDQAALDGEAVDQRAVAAAEILDRQALLGDHQRRVASRHARVEQGIRPQRQRAPPQYQPLARRHGDAPSDQLDSWVIRDAHHEAACGRLGHGTWLGGPARRAQRVVSRGGPAAGQEPYPSGCSGASPPARRGCRAESAATGAGPTGSRPRRRRRPRRRARSGCRPVGC